MVLFSAAPQRSVYKNVDKARGLFLPRVTSPRPWLSLFAPRLQHHWVSLSRRYFNNQRAFMTANSTTSKPTVAFFGATGGCAGNALALSLRSGHKCTART